MTFPTVVRRATAASSDTAASSFTPSFTWSLDTPISGGDRVLWVAFIVANNGSLGSTISAPGWTGAASDELSSGRVTVHAILKKETTAAYSAGTAPSLVIANTSSGTYAVSLLAFKVSSGSTVNLLASTSAKGTTTNTDPPAMTNGTGAIQDMIVVAARAALDNKAVSSTPSGYASKNEKFAGGGATKRIVTTSEASATVADGLNEDPGPYTSDPAAWVSYTIGVYEVASGSRTADLARTLDGVSLGAGASLLIAASLAGSLEPLTLSANAAAGLGGRFATLSSELDGITVTATGSDKTWTVVETPDATWTEQQVRHGAPFDPDIFDPAIFDTEQVWFIQN